jgi:hypothetical protein
MSTPPLNQPSFRFPFTLPENLDPGVRHALEYAFNGITNHEQAFAALKPQVDNAVSAATGTTTSGGTTTVSDTFVNNVATAITSPAGQSALSTVAVTQFNEGVGTVDYFPNLGTVNDQLGNVLYMTQQSDNGAKIIVGDSSAVSVSLNAQVSAPWFTIIDNDSGSVATLMPDSGATVFGSNSIQPGGFGIIFFDGTNFWSGATAAAGVTQIVAGTGITISPPGGTGVVTINADSSGGGGVTSIDGITGAVSLVAGSGITISDNTPTAGDITIAATGGGGGSFLTGSGTVGVTFNNVSSTNITVAGATTSMVATACLGQPVTFNGTDVGPQCVMVAGVTSANTVTVTTFGVVSGGSGSFPVTVIVFT